VKCATALITVVIAAACGGDDGGTATATATATVADDEGSSSASTSASGSESDGTGTASASADSESEGSASGSSGDTSATNTTTEGGNTSSGDSTEGGSETGPACAAMDESCANGEVCCNQLQCCEGVPVRPGEEYCSVMCPDSDRNIKENFSAIDPDATLAKLAALPVTSWNYTFEDPRVRHIGPMAQDFKTTFEVGGTDKAIAKVDADGVALAAIQALHRRTNELRAENDDLRKRLAKLEHAAEAL
jgi:hypothetical protein